MCRVNVRLSLTSQTEKIVASKPLTINYIKIYDAFYQRKDRYIHTYTSPDSQVSGYSPYYFLCVKSIITAVAAYVPVSIFYT